MNPFVIVALVLLSAAATSLALDSDTSLSLGPSPSDWISERDIRNSFDGVFIPGNFTLGRIEPTGSMLPLMDNASTALLMAPVQETIKPGDIVAYLSAEADGKIVHRVIEVGEDEQGWFIRTQGDNADRQDPDKVRYEDVVYVVVAVIY